MGCSPSKAQRISTEGKRQYRMRMEPETTMTDLADRGEPEGEEMGLDRQPKEVPNQAVRDCGNVVMVESTRLAGESISNLADMSFNDRQELKVANKRVLRNK